MTANPFAALLAGVPRCHTPDGTYLHQDAVLAALAAAVPADLAEAGKVLEGVTAGKWEAHHHDEYSELAVYHPEFTGLGHFYEAADANFIAWCREGVPSLLARIAALEVAHHVNETPKSEHDSADVLTEYTLAPHLKKIVDGANTAPQWDMVNDRFVSPPADVAGVVAEAGKVAERLSHGVILSGLDLNHRDLDKSADTIRALIALASAQAAQIGGLEVKSATLTEYAAAVEKSAETAETALAAERAKVARLVEALVEHNDLLRSAFEIAKREGVKGEIASTNWDAYYNRVAVVLKRHHQTANAARAAITEAGQ